MEQSVAHVQLQRGKMAVAAEMPLGLVFFQQFANVSVGAVALRQRKVFARVAGFRAVHAGQKADAHRGQQNDHTQGETQGDQRRFVKMAKTADKRQSPPEKRRDPANAAQQHHRQQNTGSQRRYADIDQLGCMGPEKGQRQHPQVFQQGRCRSAGQKTGQTAPCGKPAAGCKQRPQRNGLQKGRQQE